MVDNPDDGGGVTGGAGDGEGFICQFLATLERTAEDELRTQGGEHECPVMMAGRQLRQRQFQDLDLVVVDYSGGTVETSVIGQCGGNQPFRVAKISSPPRSIEEGLAESRIPCLALGRPEPDGRGVIAKGVSRGKGAEGRVACLTGVADGLRQVDGLSGIEPVPRQFTHT